MSCGIYKITNTETNKMYVGSSKNIEQRIRNHFNLLKSKSHHSVKLQRAYDKYGLSCFTHEVLELCEVEALFIREQHWIDSLDSYHSGYNASESSVYPTNKHSLSILDKNSKHIENIIYNLIEIQDMRDSIPTDVIISCEGIGADSSGKLRFVKYLRASEILKSILKDIVDLPKDSEYTIVGINYKQGAIENYRIKPVTDKYKFRKTHEFFKTNYIYDQLVQAYLREISFDKYGSWIIEEMGRRGISFDAFRVDLKTY